MLGGWRKSQSLSSLLSEKLGKKSKRPTSAIIESKVVIPITPLIPHCLLQNSLLQHKSSSIHDLAALAAEIPSRRANKNGEQTDSHDEVTGQDHMSTM